MVLFRRGDNLLGSRFRKNLNQLGQMAGIGSGPLKLWKQPQARLVTLPSGGTWGTGTTDGITDDVNSATCKQVLWVNTDHATTPNEYVASNIDVKVYNEAGLTEPAVGDIFWALWNKQSGRWCLIGERSSIKPYNCSCSPCSTSLSQTDVAYRFEFKTFYSPTESFQFGSTGWVDECCQHYDIQSGDLTGLPPCGFQCQWGRSTDTGINFPQGCGGESTQNEYLLLIVNYSGSNWRWELTVGSPNGTIGKWVTTGVAAGSFDCSPTSNLSLSLDSGGECYNNNQQAIDITGSPTGGTYKLDFDGEITADINVNADPTSALEALSNIGTGEINVTGSYPNWKVEFYGPSFIKAQQTLLVLDTNSLTGGTSPSVSLSHAVDAATYTFPTTITLSPVSAP